MRFVGIDVASETHTVAAVTGDDAVVLKPSSFAEDAGGYERLFEKLGSAEDTLVAMEATGHYWKNLFAALVARGFGVALLNPLRTRRFAEEDLERTKTDAIDALGIARFAAQKRPAVTRLPDVATEELRELVRLRDRIVQEIGDRVRQLHRLVDLGFPEFTRYVRTLDSYLATALLHAFPTAKAFERVGPTRVSKIVYDGRHRVGKELATQLVEAARRSVGAHHGSAYQVQVRYLCEDLDVLRQRLREVDGDLERHLDAHEVGSLLTTIDGIGPLTAARLIAELGDPTSFESPAALAAYVGAIPALRQSGKRTGQWARLTPHGHFRLRQALWMPTLTAVRRNPWLRAYYQRLRANGKPAKVALVASMRKLLLAVYAVARDRKPFVPHLPAHVRT
jgi:transposase